MTRFAHGLAGALLLLLAAGSARADALVRVAPHRTAIGGHADSRPLYGYLARPAGRGTIPAVVVLHGCGGMGPSDVTTAATLRSWGYVALALDSLGNANTCGQTGGAVAEAFDAYAALKYLAALRDVDPRRVAVVGFSMGGVAALQILETGLIEQLWPEHFRAAVAYYPQCQSSSGVMSAPVLILIGDRDDWAPAAACRAMLARRGGKGAP
jgi:dienelactone hydrolase